MKVTGVRELKNRLSEYLRVVRSGENVMVTDRGEAVAEIVQPGKRTATDLPAGLLELSQMTSMTTGGKNDPNLYPPQKRLGTKFRAQKLLNEERGER